MGKGKKEKFFKLNAKIKSGNIILDKNTFEHIMHLLFLQKHRNDKPSSGLSISEIKKAQKVIGQETEDCIEQGDKILKNFYKSLTKSLLK